MQRIKTIIQKIRYIEGYISPTWIFAIKCVIVTLCIGNLLSNYMPKYEFLDSSHRVNKVTGESEYYSNSCWDKGWHQ